MTDYESILSAASQLSADERGRLIDDLWTINADTPLSDEWIKEIQRRSARIDSGESDTVPWEELRERLLQKAGECRAD